MANLSFQSNAYKGNHANLTDYALFMGGLNVTHEALKQYDPLRTGFGRIFMIRKPVFLDVDGYSDKLKNFKHILEYANIGVNGNNNITMNFNQMQGGYTNRQMEMPNIATDDANELTIRTYEFSGSPVREVLELWMNGVADFQSGFAHYNGYVNVGAGSAGYGNAVNGAKGLDYSQANHTAEFIYAVTDPTGVNVEYAALFANCFPKEIKLDHFNMESGQHDLVQLDVSFTCTRYRSPQINAAAAALLKKYSVLVNSLNFNAGVNKAIINSTTGTFSSVNGSSYNPQSGKIESEEYANPGVKFAEAYAAEESEGELPKDGDNFDTLSV